MTTPPDFGVLRQAVELLTAPHPQVLACLDRDDQPWGMLAGIDPVAVDAAIIRLVGLGVIHRQDSAHPSSTGSLTLTPKGREVARLVAEDVRRFPIDREPVFDLEVESASSTAE
jgi:hypothetical protein